MRLPAPGEAPQHSEVKISGVTLKRFQPSGKPEWTLQVNENQIVASCFRYGRWNAVWQQSRQWMASAVERVSADDNPVTAMAMQVVDRFEQALPSATDYDIEDVFNKGSPFLTEQAAKSGAQWHVFQGWFDSFSLLNDADCRILNVLNLSCSQQGARLHSVIDHTLQLQLTSNPVPTQPTSIFDLANSDSTSIVDKVFEKLHDTNKSILRRTLSPRQLQAINLGQGDQ